MATRSRIQTLESRVNSRLGSGSMRKSWLSMSEVTSPNPPRTSSLRMPAVRYVVSCSGDDSVSSGRR